ncbi:hypothetical protein JCM24511_05505 [Saitozyma sp. JCM 24511]|nr:hypothetical protein JCM24511_05505 [Saitozyma sp. JCM 24511]
MANPSDQDAALLSFRQAANFRSVTRNDPSVTEIIETSVYSTIYHYDDQGNWEKQKMEGSTFIVHRDKSPEYAIYMLNRQTVKNVTIPLVPGEIKVTAVGESMLQVARRGDKVRRGIWFSEGEEGVERFRRAILRICGEPSARPDLAANLASSASASPASPAPRPAAPTDDGLSRLFAGLVSSPAAPPRTPQAASATTSSTTATTIQSTLPSHQAPPAVPFASHPQPPLGATEPLPPPIAPAAPPPAPFYPPGQTVDDLLMSILGATPLPAPVQHAPAPLAPSTAVAPPPPPVPVATKPGHENAAAAQSPTQSRQWAKVGDSTFAQAAKIAATNGHTQSHMSPQPLPGMVPSPNPPAMTTPQAAHGRAGPSPLPTRPDGLPPAPPPGMQDAVADSMVARFGRSLSSEEKAAQGRFVAHLLELVHTDPGFVDEIWQGYLRRASGGPG